MSISGHTNDFDNDFATDGPNDFLLSGTGDVVKTTGLPIPDKVNCIVPIIKDDPNL